MDYNENGLQWTTMDTSNNGLQLQLQQWLLQWTTITMDYNDNGLQITKDYKLQ